MATRQWSAKRFKSLRKAYCERHGLTVAEFAESVGISRVHVYKLEQGVRTPSLDTADALANVLHVRIEDLMG